jgi:hypothetical protein
MGLIRLLIGGCWLASLTIIVVVVGCAGVVVLIGGRVETAVGVDSLWEVLAREDLRRLEGLRKLPSIH